MLLKAVLALASLCYASAETLRVGHFPNITHAQALVGHHLSREGKGWFEQRLPAGVKLEWHVYNAGPAAMEAIFTGAIDLAYVGPSPTINAHVRSGGKDIRVVAGACSGGSALLVAANSGIQELSDFKGKRVATPQLGNTQDVAARTFFRRSGFKVTLTGGDIYTIPSANPDQLILLKKGTLDAAWTVEPWVSRLERDAGARVFLDERELWPETNGRYVTTHLASGTKALAGKMEAVRAFIGAHLDLTVWIQENNAEARRMIIDEIRSETRQALAPDLLESAWRRIELTHDPIALSLRKAAAAARDLGFLQGEASVARIYELSLLNSALRDRGMAELR